MNFCVLVLGSWILLTSCSYHGAYIKIPTIEMERVECVILLHGLGRTYRSMGKMEKELRRTGYITVNLDYPSTSKNIESIVSEHLPEALEQCLLSNVEKIHFVTHSMGGIVVRKALKENRPEKLGRVVMLSPPNQGSELVDALKNDWYYKLINGPAGQQLSTASDSLPNTLGAVGYPVGIIVGDKPAVFDVWFTTFIPEDNDGKVAVERAKVDGMSDFLVVHESHTYIMDSEYVQDQTVHFLQHGSFRQDRDTQVTNEELGTE